MGYSADKSPLIGHFAGPTRRLEPLGAQRQEKGGPNHLTREGLHATTPRTRAWLQAAQFATRYFVLYVGWTFDFIPVVWLLRRVTRSAGQTAPPQRVFMQQRHRHPPRPCRTRPGATRTPLVPRRNSNASSVPSFLSWGPPKRHRTAVLTCRRFSGRRHRDWAAERTNTPLEVVEAALAHTVQNPTEAAYARSDLFERRRRLMDDWATYLGTECGQVVRDH